MEKLYSTGDIAKIVGITRQAVRWNVKQGNLRARQAGRLWVINAPDLARFIKARSARAA